MGTRRLSEVRDAMRQWRPEVKVATVVGMGWLGYVGSSVIPSYQAAQSGHWVIFAYNLLVAGLATFAFILALWWALPRTAGRSRRRRQ